jgi:hypothetical protein
MKEENRDLENWSSQDAKNGELNRALDEALAKYAAVEPRAGLKERILANLRANGSQQPTSTGRTWWRSWWRWNTVAAAVAVAAVVIVVVALVVKWGRPPHPAIANHPSTTQPGPTPTTQAANRDLSVVSPQIGHLRKPVPFHRTLAYSQERAGVVAANPKLDQFPSPQPLSAQEKILEKYAAEYPEQAALIAQARMKALREDELEEMSEAESDRDSGAEKDRKTQPATH